MTPVLDVEVPSQADLSHISEGLWPLAVPIHSLFDDPVNARKHTEENMKAIRASLQRFGQQKPIVYDGERIVRAGNGTRTAAVQLGWKYIAACPTKLKGAEAMAYGLVDNKSGDLAEWDFENLSTQLRGLTAEGFDLSFTGFQTFEVTPLLQAEWLPPAPTGNLEVADQAQGSMALRVPAELVPTVSGCFQRIKDARHILEPGLKDIRALELLCVAYISGGVDMSMCPLPRRPVDSRLPKLRTMTVSYTVACPTCRNPIVVAPTAVGMLNCITCGEARFEVIAKKKK
jgi:hypothetical protein